MIEKPKFRYCPNHPKKRYPDRETALELAEELSREFQATIKPIFCVCGSWHTYDLSKKRRKIAARETKAERKARIARGDPSPAQLEHEQRVQQQKENQKLAHIERKRKRQQRRRHKKQHERIEFANALCIWDDDGGAFFSPKDPA